MELNMKESQENYDSFLRILKNPEESKQKENNLQKCSEMCKEILNKLLHNNYEMNTYKVQYNNYKHLTNYSINKKHFKII